MFKDYNDSTILILLKVEFQTASLHSEDTRDHSPGLCSNTEQLRPNILGTISDQDH